MLGVRKACRELADSVHEILQENDQLRAENAKLRNERDHYKALWEHATVTDCELRRVRAAWKEDREKNAKLRRLVRDMWEGYNDPRCEECHLKDTPTCADCPICARESLVIDRMRDLGIEVDG